jgi:hypothetical protein
MEYVIFHIEGGIGKNILATAVVKAIQKFYPNKKIVIVTAWADVWVNNPLVYRTYIFGALNYFYDEFVKDQESLVFMHDPYHETNHFYKREHLIETWCKLIGVPFNGETPELYLTPRETEFVKNSILGRVRNGKPLLVIQPNGGSQEAPYSWARDIPYSTAQEIVNFYSKDYQILQIKRESQPLLNGAIPLTLPLRQIFAILTFSDKRLFIDSFGQHAAAALNLPSVVTWVANSPKVFGYDIHTNIVTTAKEAFNTTKYSYLQPYNILGDVKEFPYDTNILFDKETILDALSNLDTKTI